LIGAAAMRVALACIFGHVWASISLDASYPIPPGYFIARTRDARPSVGAAEEPKAQPRLRHSLLHETQLPLLPNLTAGPESAAVAAQPVAAQPTQDIPEASSNDTSSNDTSSNGTSSNDTEGSASSTPSAAFARNGFSGNPYDGVLAYPHSEESNPPVELHLDVARVMSIECLKRMISDPSHECKKSQLGGATGQSAEAKPPASMQKAKEAMELAREAEQAAIAAARAAETAAEAVSGQPPCSPNASAPANESVALVRTEHFLSPTSASSEQPSLAPAAAAPPPPSRFLGAEPPVGVVVHHKLRRSDNLHQE